MQTPYEFQKTLIDELGTAVIKSLPKRTASKFVYDAPTGSGKTLTMAWTLEKIYQESEDKFWVLWLSIGTGGLETQSAARVKTVYQDTYLLDDISSESVIVSGTIVVANWEHIKAKKKGYDWNFSTDTPDGVSLATLAKIKKKQGFKLIIVIDESHQMASSNLSNLLMEELRPNITIEMSATPLKGDHDRRFKIEIEDVIAEGLIRERVRVNHGLEKEVKRMDKDDQLQTGLNRLLLQTALNKREYLASLYEKEGSQVCPLLLIQLPTKGTGFTVDDVIEILDKKDITTKNGRLAIWLSERKENLENIKSIQNKVEVLIFKVAIATGWDCPRSQVIVQLRDIKSETLDIQTIGRVRRQAEPKRFKEKAYQNSALNYAYLYSSYRNNIELEREANYTRHILLTRNPHLYSDLKLESHTKSILHLGNLSPADEIKKYLAREWEGLKVETTSNVEHEIVKDLEMGLTHDPTTDEKKLKVLLSLNEISQRFIAQICNQLNGFSKNSAILSLQPAIEDAIQECFPEINKSDVVFSQAVYLNNKKLRDCVDIFISKERAAIKEKLQPYETKLEWEVPEEQTVDANGSNIVRIREKAPCLHSLASDEDKYVQNGFSDPEETFVRIIEDYDNNPIIWWWKNGDKGNENFGIPFKNSRGVDDTFYPDFLLLYKKTDRKKLVIIETKDASDEDPDTQIKRDALKDYTKRSPSKTLPVIGDVFYSQKGSLRTYEGTSLEVFLDEG
jgi:type III restriction enzyme